MSAAASSRPAAPPGPYLVAGLRRAGRAAAGALVAHAGAASVSAWDASDDDLTRAARDELEALGVRVTLGGDGVDLLTRAPQPACVVKSPGIPPRAPLVAAAAGRVVVIDELELGWRLDDRPVVAITGTNGKSTVAELTRAVLAAAGRRPVLAGNTDYGEPLSALPADAGDLVVCETSSFQLASCPAFRPDAAVLTNLADDHARYHGTPDRYAACKRRLFLGGGGAPALSVVGVDEEFGAGLAGELSERGAPVLRVGEGGEYRLRGADTSWGGTSFTADTPAGETRVRVASPGEHMARNALAALALADGLGVPREISLAAIERAAPVPGRFERVDDGLPFAVVVDFAHNPDGMRCALQTARALAAPGGRVLAVANALWIHDERQQERMGRAVAEGADEVTITTDRWFATEPADPVPAFVRGVRAAASAAARVEPDRDLAIAAAIGSAAAGDVVIMFGRGARLRMFSQAGDLLAFDDREQARSALAQLA